MGQVLNLRHETIKLLEASIGETLHTVFMGKNLNKTPVGQAIKLRVDTKCDFKLKSCCIAKGSSQQSEKTASKMEENICEFYI